ncbi:transmembrane protein 19-like isoform X1 [Tubulanus polymorphus]|uniref:transmembrane protein 19-like isoform X1 n=1 Tax=Tubulanus polymorphus TaxID=672921 RepID=UPI003DA4C81F
MSRDVENMFLAKILSLQILLSLIFWLCNLFFHWYGAFDDTNAAVSPWRCLLAFVVPLWIVRRARRHKSLDDSGAITAFLVGFVLTISNYCFFACLLAFFTVTSKATKFRGSQKRKFEEDFKEGGQRNWIQVLCNGGMATELAIIYMMDVGCTEVAIDFSRKYNASWLSMAVVGALACSCGDTLASELGTVIFASWRPRLITTLRSVPKGTNGGVSLVGLISSCLGGFVVGVAFYLMLLSQLPSDYMDASPAQWPVIVVATIAGLLGSVIDSLLGATLQYSGFSKERQCIVENAGEDVDWISGVGILDNHSVNLIAGLLTSMLTPRIAFAIWRNFVI